jgi:hypothetical protein
MGYFRASARPLWDEVLTWLRADAVAARPS